MRYRNAELVFDALRDLPQAVSGGMEIPHRSDGALLLGNRAKRSVVINLEAKLTRAAEVSPTTPLLGLHFSDALTNAVALELGYPTQDREHELGDSVSGAVATKVKQIERNLAASEIADDAQSIVCRPKHSIQLACDHGVAGLQRLLQLLALGPAFKRLGATDASLNEDTIDRLAEFKGAPLDLPLLDL
jgi:hypothetical protein